MAIYCEHLMLEDNGNVSLMVDDAEGGDYTWLHLGPIGDLDRDDVPEPLRASFDEALELWADQRDDRADWNHTYHEGLRRIA